MNIIQFPPARVIEINQYILKTGTGLKGGADQAKLEGALGRIDHSIVYDGLDDIFDIAAKYAKAISASHAFSDANKRTGLAVCLEYLSLNDYEISIEEDELADVMVALVTNLISEIEFANILYGIWDSQNNSL